MGDTERPPINEVVVSVAFDAQPLSTGPQLLISLADLLASFPTLQEQGPYEMPEELPPDDEVLKPAVPQLSIVNGMLQMDRRYWLTAGSPSPFLLQAQSNYFALNWRDQGERPEYPGFRSVEADFYRHIGVFDASIQARGGEPLQIKQVEVTYINVLRPDAVWSDFDQLRNVLEVDFAGLSNAEQVGLTYSNSRYMEGSFSGRVHTSLQTGYQPRDVGDVTPRPLTRAELSPVINVSITARSARIKASTSDLADHVCAAHDSTTEAFRSLMTPAALANWGLE